MCEFVLFFVRIRIVLKASAFVSLYQHKEEENMDKLLLELHFNAQNYGKLVLKTAGQLFRLERLENALRLVASLHQLSKAIDAGTSKDCGYELKDRNGKEWLLECKFIKGLVDLQLWFQNLGFNERLETLFNWRGPAEDFVKAINGMIERMPRYRFVWFGF